MFLPKKSARKNKVDVLLVIILFYKKMDLPCKHINFYKKNF